MANVFRYGNWWARFHYNFANSEIGTLLVFRVYNEKNYTITIFY